MSSRNCQLHLSVFDHADHTEIDVRSICKPHTFFLMVLQHRNVLRRIGLKAWKVETEMA
jgi:hypothetical protein